MSKYLKLLENSVVTGNIPSFVQSLLAHALELWASDVHIEPAKKLTNVRFRVDWILRSIIQLSVNLHPSLVSRIKIMGNLKIDEQRKPQDGKAAVVTDDGKSMDLRINTLPTVFAEKIVMRLQDKNRTIPTFEELGIRWSALKNLNEWVTKPNWIVLVTGPTGSGKTTTLYSGLFKIKNDEVNIMTLEDPVEYQMSWVTQSQIKADIWYTFAEGLRAALRQDPDIVMLWEIRDLETVEIAIKAALTGHLVLSTIHTNSAIATISRVTDMWIKPYLFAAAINAIQAQRLVRKVCKHCKEAYKPSKKVINEIKHWLENLPKTEGVDLSTFNDIRLAKWKWCDKCWWTGYSWRVWLYEVLTIDKDLKTLISKWSDIEVIEDHAKNNGFVTMYQDWLIKALAWLTTIEEVMSITNND